MIRSTEATQRAPDSCAAAAISRVLHDAEEVRVLDEDGGDVGVDVVLELARVREPVAQSDLDDLGAEAPRVGLERRARVRMQAPRDDEPRSLALAAPSAR